MVHHREVKLTKPQKQVLHFIAQSLEERGVIPTLREICNFMGYRAIGSAQDLVLALKKKGYLKPCHEQRARSLILTPKARQVVGIDKPTMMGADELFLVPCLGQVPAGDPLEAIEEETQRLPVSPAILPHPRPKQEKLFALRTVGDSMTGAGILDGDWLIVKAEADSEPGAIVIARLEDEVTCKRLGHHVRKGWYLKPENPRYPEIYATDRAFEIIGRVVALQRSIVR